STDLDRRLPSPPEFGGREVLGVRPIAFAPPDGTGRLTTTVTPKMVEDLGDARYVIFDVTAARVDTEATRAAMEARTAEDALLIPEERAQFTARLPADVPASAGSPLTLAIDPHRLHFFDPATGLAR